MNDVQGRRATARMASLGPPRRASAAPPKLIYTRTVFQSAFLLICAAPTRSGSGWDEPIVVDYGVSFCPAIKPATLNRQQKWCLRGVFDGTSRGESSSGRTQPARIKNWAKNARGGSISSSRWHRKSLATPPRCASPAANEAKLKLYATCAMATAQPLVAQRTNGPCTHGLETFRARR